jgi:molecular chaperone GrpE
MSSGNEHEAGQGGEQAAPGTSDAASSQGDPTVEAEAAPPGPAEQIAALEVEKRELRERMLRVAAEFENWKKRARKEVADAEGKGKESVLRDFLEIGDNLERASAVGDGVDLKTIQQGVALVLRQFQQKLERHEVKVIEAKGQAFDPRLHDAISQVPTADAPAGSVISELQRGYRIGDRLLRPAMVVVAVAPPSAVDAGAQGGGVADGAGSGEAP